jgi:type IV pilus assembly protein PilP
MRTELKHFFSIGAVLLLSSLFLWSCKEQQVESKAPVVSQRIVVSKTPKAAETEPATHAETSATTAGKESEGDLSASSASRIYDPEKRLDPFARLFKTEEKQVTASAPSVEKRKKRIPRTPLERISLDQLNLVAIVRAASGNKALVEDSSGKGFIINKGSYIGLNSGIVTQINPNSFVVEEELANLMGELTLQKTEIKLQKPAGE